MEQHQFSCIKCSGTEYRGGEIRTTGSGLSRFFNLQNQKFATLSCSNCGYTELYRMDGGGVGNILDIGCGAASVQLHKMFRNRVYRWRN